MFIYIRFNVYIIYIYLNIEIFIFRYFIFIFNLTFRTVTMYIDDEKNVFVAATIILAVLFLGTTNHFIIAATTAIINQPPTIRCIHFVIQQYETLN